MNCNVYPVSHTLIIDALSWHNFDNIEILLNQFPAPVHMATELLHHHIENGPGRDDSNFVGHQDQGKQGAVVIMQAGQEQG